MKFLFFIVFIVTIVAASIFNNTLKEKYIDIGKTIGFSNIETPIVKIPMNPIYTGIAKTIINKSRNRISESCIVDENGNENCPIGEVECSNNIIYGHTYMQTHTGKVIDYVKSVNTIDDFEPIGTSYPFGSLDGWRAFNAFKYELDGLRPATQESAWGSFGGVVTDLSKFPSYVPALKGYYQYGAIPQYTGYTKVFDFGVENANTKINISYDILAYGTFDDKEEVKVFLNGKIADEIFAKVGIPCNRSYVLKIQRGIAYRNAWNPWTGYPWRYPHKCTMYKGDVHKKNFHRELANGTLDNQGKLTVDIFSNLNEDISNESFSFDNFSINADKLVGYVYNKFLNKFTKEINYKYYSYTCDSGYQLSDIGRKNCSKTDIDRDTYDESFLALDCNAPNLKNCYKAESQCPLDSNKKCTFKGNTYNIFVPLKKFEFETSFFKPWEYGKKRGFNCTTSVLGLNCEFGINEIDASTDGVICFSDVHNYRSCISYIDKSECKIRGKIKRLNGKAIKSIVISKDRKTLTLLDNSNTLSDINVSENFNSSADGWSNRKIAISKGVLGSYLGKFGKGEFTQKKYLFGKKNANRVVNVSFDFYRIDAWKEQKFNFSVNGELFNVSRYSENDNETATLVTPTDESTNAFPEAIFHRSYDVKLNYKGELVIAFSSNLSEPSSSESFGIDNLSITSESVSPGKITTNCMFYGKFGFSDVNIGTIAVYADKNRLTFWNSYDTGVVGFLDILPKKAVLLNTNSTVKFSFDSGKRVMVDEATNGNSKERISLGYKTTFGSGKIKNSIILTNDINSSAIIIGSKDIAFLGRTSLEISFDIKTTITNNRKVLLDNGSQVTILINKDDTLSWKLNTKDGFGLYTTQSKIIPNSWNRISLVFDKSIVSLYINGIGSSVNVGSTIEGKNEKELFIGRNVLNAKKAFVSVDNFTISSSVKNQEYYELFSLENADFYDYIREASKDVKSLYDKGFNLLYESENKHTYMVYKNKISARECLQKISGTSFDLASPNANLNSFKNTNLIEIDKIIKGNCKNTSFNDCLNENNNTKCGELSIMNCNHSVIRNNIDLNNTCDANSSLVAKEILKACDEKRLIEGISLQSQIFDNPTTPYNCIIESESAIPFIMYNKTAVAKQVKNSGKFINTFVCSINSCKNHICGYMQCPDETLGNVGVKNGYTGCIKKSCDLSKPYYSTCGIFGACPEGLDIVNSSITSIPTLKNEYHIELSGSGTYTSLAPSKNTVLVNGKNVSNFIRGWNIITLDSNYDLLEDKKFLIQNSTDQIALKNYLSLFKPSQVHIIAIKEDVGNILLDSYMKSVINSSGLSLTKIEYFEHGDAYLYVGKKFNTPMVEKYVKKFGATIISDFILQKVKTQQQCYKVLCPSGSIFDVNSKSCFTIGCDVLSFLKDGKCISKIAK